jgi:hypothetical protein
MKNRTLALMALGAILSFGFVHAVAQEQRHFSAEDEGVKEPVPVPQTVFEILKQNSLVTEALSNENLSPDKLPVTWFSASFVHLKDAQEDDLVVIGIGPLRHANTVTFWVFRHVDGNDQLILTVMGHDLRILDHRTMDFNDIEASAISQQKVATINFEFDGKEYIRSRNKTTQ